MKRFLSIASACLVLSAPGVNSWGQDAPNWVPELLPSRFGVSWDRATIAWTVPLSAFARQPAGSLPVTMVLEYRQTSEGVWSELGRFSLQAKNHTNQTPWPDPPEIRLPERIFAPPPWVGGSSGGVISFLGGSNINHATYTHHRLDPDTVYQYRMKAVNGSGDGPYSPEFSVRTNPLPPPQRPFDSFVGNEPGTGLTVMWTRSKLASEFLVERMTAGEPWQQVAVVDGALHSWTDTGVIPGVSYRYQVRARNISGTSDPGLESSAVAQRIQQVFQAPAGNEFSAPWQQRGGVIPGADPEVPDRNILWFSGAGSRSLTTRPLVFLIGGFFEFDFWSNQYQAWPNEILVQATLNGMVWTDLGRIYPESDRGNWRRFSIQLPPSWSSPTVQFRFLNTGNHDEGAGTWAIRDIRVLAVQGNESAAPTIRIHEPLERTTTQSRPSIKLVGSALDNQRLLGWTWSVNGGPWSTSRLRSGKRAPWNGVIRGLARGRNVIEVRAYDASGNLSVAESRIVRVR
jgi:hypothetical protein